MKYGIEFLAAWSKEHEVPDGTRAIALMVPNPDYIEYPSYPAGQCDRCGKKLTGRRWKYCSDRCCDIYYKTSKPVKAVYWADIRYLVLKRDKYTCVECGAPGSEVHHILPIRLYGRQFDPDNCQTLCSKCHKFKHAKRSCEHPDQTRLGV